MFIDSRPADHPALAVRTPAGLFGARRQGVSRRLAQALALLLSIPLSACDGGRQPGADATSPPSGSLTPVAAGAAGGISPDGTSHLRAVDGRLTARLRDQPLSAVLEAIARQAAVPIEISPGLRTRLVSADVQDMPLAQGLTLLLRDFDVVLSIGAGGPGSAGPSLQAAWVYPRGQGPGRAASGVAAAGGVCATVAAPGGGAGPCSKRDAHPAALPPGAISPQQITQAVLSSDAQVRHRAVDLSLTQPLPLPVSTLRQLATDDPDAEVRMLALTALAHSAEAPATEVSAVLQRALQDRSTTLREHAQELLEQLALAVTPNEATALPVAAPDAGLP